MALPASFLDVPHVEIKKSDIQQVRDCDVVAEGSASVLPLLRAVFSGKEQESCVILLLDNRQRVIAWREVSRGACNNVQVPPREIFRTALLCGGVSLIVSHNHPSGDPAPSQQDYMVTMRLQMAGEVIGVPVLDHLIIGDGEKYYSFAEAAKPASESPAAGSTARPPPELD